MSEPTITDDSSSLSERNKVIADLWNSHEVITAYFIVGDEVQDKKCQATKLGSGWDDELDLVLGSIGDSHWNIRTGLGRTDQIEGTLYKDVFLTEREAIEKILPSLEMRLSWIGGLVAGYRARLGELS